jgi:TRAP-type C4-dicarboxylate transport system substrate-binding protein
MKLTCSKTLSIAAAAGLAVTAGASVSSTASAKELKLAHFMPPVHHLHRNMFEPLAKDLAAATNGKLTIKVYSSGALGKGPVQQYKRVVQGVADIAFGVLVYTPKLFPKTMVASNPGIGETSGEVTKKMWDIYGQHLKDEYNKAHLLALFANWPAVLISRSKPINSVADLKGMKIRTSSPFDIPHVNTWGSVGVYMPVTKTYNGLQNGVIDAVQIAPSALYRPWNLAEPGAYVTHGVKGPSSLFFVMMNAKSWAGLSASEKAAINKLTGKDASIKISESWGSADQKALAAAANGKQINLIRLTKQQAAGIDALTEKSVLAQLAKQDQSGVPATKVYKALLAAK